MIDCPATEGGRAYLVERELETKSELDALIADYLQQATKLDSPPLAVCPLENKPRGQRMSDRNPLILQVQLAGAESYQLGDEIWQQPLSDAIRAEAEIVVDHAGPDLLPMPSPAARVALRDRILAEMTAALRRIGDTYTAPDGVAYTLTDETQLDLPARQDTLVTMSPTTPAPVVEEVLRFEDLPGGPSSGDGPTGL